MITKINSCAFLGIDGVIIETEVDVSKGVPSFEIVGLPDTAIKESKERVRSALKLLPQSKKKVLCLTFPLRRDLCAV